MWPFSGIRGQAKESQDVQETSIGEFRSTPSNLSTIRLDPIAADTSAIWSDRLTDLFFYWKGKCRGGLSPTRTDIDPLDIPALLPIVFLVDVSGDPVDFRFRLVGSEFARKYGASLTGRTLREVNRHAHSEAILNDYAICAKDRVALVSRNSFINDQGVFWKYERILMPLRDEAGQVRMIMGGMDINIPLSELPRPVTPSKVPFGAAPGFSVRAR